MDQESRFIETFRQEAHELLAVAEEAILDLEENPNDPESIHRLFRSMHTIKGSGAMFGFDEIADFTHHVETVLDKVREGVIPVSSELVDLIFLAKDQIKAMLDVQDTGREADPSLCDKVIARLNALLPEAADSVSSPAPGKAPESANVRKERIFRIRFRPHADMMTYGMDPTALLDELREIGECEVTACTGDIPRLAQLEAEKLYLSWDILLTTFCSHNAVSEVFVFVEESDVRIQALDDSESPRLGEILVARGDTAAENVREVLTGRKRVGELLVASGIVSEEIVASALAEQKVLEKRKGGFQTDSIRISSDKLDRLINLVGEMVITQAHLSQMVEDNEENSFSAPVRQMERLNRELRDFALEMRMLPVNTVFSKFRRMVRDLSAELGKEIELIIEGGETELDKSILDRLHDPLVHLIRNSIDHGLRSPEIRQQHGKPRKGTIRLTAAHHGARVEITVADDGMGIDRDSVRAKAIEKGLIPADAVLKDEEIHDLIFAPGFSTAKTVSDVSGRGVGMDVVKREISALGGMIRVSSDAGKGSAVHLSLPLTLAIITGLHVRTEGRDYILPVSQVENCEELKNIRPEKSGNRQMIRIKGEQIPFLRLRDVFRIPGNILPAEQAALVQTGNSRIALVTDEIIGNIQTVIKPLDRLYRHAKGISGATVMGDGSVALIIDLTELIACAKKDEKKLSFSGQTKIIEKND